MNPPHLESLVGKVLKTDLVDKYGAIVIPKGKIVQIKDIQKAKMHPISVVPECKELSYQDVLNEVIAQLRAVFTHVRQSGKAPFRELQQSVFPMINYLIQTPEVSLLLSELERVDDYTVAHSVAVGVLATLLGKWLGIRNGELEALSLAAILHDVGKMKVPLHILNKPGRLTVEEFDEMKKHTVYGYEILQATSGIANEQCVVALQHHERIDGSGYPHQRKEREITNWSKIVGVVDVFHAMSTKRVYHDAKPLHEILQEMEDGKFGLFDVDILTTFLLKMMQTLVGKRVELSNGQVGQVVVVYDRHPTRPLVRCESGFLNLSENYSISMTKILGE